MLVSFFIDTITKLVQEKELIFDELEGTEDHGVVRIFEQKGNSSMYIFAMETIDDFLIGFLGIDYVREKHEITEKEKEYLRKQAYSLAGYIYNKDFE